jgi:flagellar biogenesis protein FliO
MATRNDVDDLGEPAAAAPFPGGNAARWLWTCLLRVFRRPRRCLRLSESLPLGDRRFVAVVEYERARFLVGGTSASLVLLTRLADRREPPDTYSTGPGERCPEKESECEQVREQRSQREQGEWKIMF